jgi:putative ubiquitin-RnfH superfamily antitoxin RatB of RatAB toxin-antitoxin module
MVDIRVVVAASLQPGQVQECALQLPAGATLADAVRASALLPSDLPLHAWPVCGIWGKVQPLTQPLHDLDRVELYRPLTVDPKVARRERFARQGARAAGLFARPKAQL